MTKVDLKKIKAYVSRDQSEPEKEFEAFGDETTPEPTYADLRGKIKEWVDI